MPGRELHRKRVALALLSPFGAPDERRLARCRRPARARASPRRAPIRTSISIDAVASIRAHEQQQGRRVLLTAGYDRRARPPRPSAERARPRPAAARRELGRIRRRCRPARWAAPCCRWSTASQTDRRGWSLTEQDILGDRLTRAAAQAEDGRRPSSPSWRTSPPATSSSMSTTASAATTGWRRWMSAARRTTACA